VKARGLVCYIGVVGRIAGAMSESSETYGHGADRSGCIVLVKFAAEDFKRP